MGGEFFIVRIVVSWSFMSSAFSGMILVEIKMHDDATVSSTIFVGRDDEELVRIVGWLDNHI